MLKNYLVVALRTLYREKEYAAISVASLVVGITACLFIGLHVQHERSFDRHLAEADRIYRLVTEEQSEAHVERTALTTTEVAPVLQAARPDLDVARLYRWPYSDILVQRGPHRFNEGRFFRTDSTVFDVFGLTWVAGDPTTALDEPYSVVLTETTAQRYFGDEDPLGASLRVGDRSEYTVSGVVRDVPSNTHVQFDFLAFNGRGFPDGWGEKKVWTYVKLSPQSNAEPLERLLPILVARHFPDYLRAATTLSLQPLTDIHLDAHLSGEVQRGGNRTVLAMLLAVALGLLVIACVNYVNLATVRAARRAREIGVRRAIGSTRGQLAAQFMLEALIASFVAVLLSVALVVALRPGVNAALGLGIPLLDWTDGALLIALGALVLVVGGVAGSYPAFYLASLRPVQALRGRGMKRGADRLVREGLVVTQFVAALVLLVGTLVIQNQVGYMLDEERGIDRDGILMLDVPRTAAVEWDWSPEVLRDALLNQPTVREVSAVDVPWGPDLEPYRIRTAVESGSHLAAHILWVTDAHYADLYGVSLREGRLDLQPVSDSDGAPVEVVLNETAAKRLGLDAPLGSDFEIDFDEAGWYRARVIGVIEDFHYRTLHHEIEPLLFVHGTGFSSVAVRVDTQNLAAAVADVGGVWQRLLPDHPFEYTFLEDDYRQQYQAEGRIGRFAQVLMALSLLIASLGLLGLTSLLVAARRKEIGVRKVLGASALRIALLFSKDIVRLVAISIVVATPLAFLAAERWLAAFAYRITLGPEVFLLAGGLALALALATVSVHTLRAATADPVHALRHE